MRPAPAFSNPTVVSRAVPCEEMAQAAKLAIECRALLFRRSDLDDLEHSAISLDWPDEGPCYRLGVMPTASLASPGVAR